jgi:hypothetical protein
METSRNDMNSKATIAAANATGTRYCAHGSHYAPADKGELVQVSRKARRWICEVCQAKKAARNG